MPRGPALRFGLARAAGRRGVPMPLPVTFDHCVVHVSDWERSNAFYRDVLGAELVRRPQGWAYLAPGNSDLCFQWDGPIAGAIVHLERYGVPIDTGPVERFGAKGAGISVYFRDPDGSLLEFISYHRKAGDHA